MLGLAASGAAAQTSAPSAAAQAPEPTPEQWRGFARQDVQASYDSYLANHPGMYDPANPDFPGQLKRARDAGLALAEKTKNFSDYRDALGAFSTELADGHAQAFAITPSANGASPPNRQWPGFVAAWRGEQLLVHHAAAGSPAPAGSVIMGCDGRQTTQLIKARLLSGNFRTEEAGQWWSRAQQTFVASPTYMQFRPERCTFRTPAGKKKEAQLSWSPAPANLTDLLTAASDGERTAIGLTEPRKGVFLIGLPDFQPNEESVKAYRALYETLRARRGELLSAKAIVLDLRHNNGGSSSWPRQAAQAIWGDQPVNTAVAHHFNKVRIWWRASEGNTAYIAKLVEQVRGNGNTAVAANMQAVGDAMTAARARGEHYYVEGSTKPAPKDLPPIVPSDLSTPVYVITPGRCASACLDALDIFARFKNVTLIGAPTSADTTYMEVRSEVLPSGKGRVVIPNKLWAGRPRGSGEVYQPKILVTDLDWSTATFLNRIERDLTSRSR